MMTPFLAFYLTLMGGEGIPARTHAAAEQIAQNYGEGAAFVGLDLTPVAAGDTATAATDWTSSISAVWEFEEASGNALDTGASTNDTMTQNGTVSRDATTFRVATQSADILSGTNYFTCADATCTGIDPAAAANFSYGCWAYMDTADTSSKYVIKKSSTTTGYELFFRPSGNGNDMRCMLQRASDLLADHTTDNTTATWYHAVCTVSDPGDITLTAYRNAAQGTSNTDSATDYAATSNQAIIGNTSAGFDGRADECFFDNAAWSQAQVARVCSGRISGALLKCSTADPTLYFPCNNNTDCGGSGVCDTGAAAISDTYCVEGASSGCCMGHNSDWCGGVDMTACNAAAP